MKDKENKLRLVKQILVDDNGLNNPIITPSKDHLPKSTIKTSSDTDTRSRKVTLYLITF